METQSNINDLNPNIFIDLWTNDSKWKVIDKLLHTSVGISRKYKENKLNIPYDTSWSMKKINIDVPDEFIGIKSVMAVFNIVVATEWNPSRKFIDDLEYSFKSAAKLLLDVTDGYMTVGQVVVGGIDWMDVADIQIFSSGRLLPASQVFGMFDTDKYRPIRLGRGLWHKRKHQPLPWSEGYGVLVHEIGHYILGLKDQYLRKPTEEDRRVVPRVNLTVDSIMSSDTRSELTDQPRRALHLGDAKDYPVSEWAQLARREEFKFLKIAANHKAEAPPPIATPQPVFCVIGDGSADGGNDRGDELEMSIPIANFPIVGAQLNHCWVFVLQKGNSDRLIGQGTFYPSAVWERFKLHGAHRDDDVILVGAGVPGAPGVFRASIIDSRDGVAHFGPWKDVTPDGPWPLVAVKPAINCTDRKRVTVQVDGGPSKPIVTLYPLGAIGPVHPQNDGSYWVSSLDGIVMLRWGDGPEAKVMVCHYSQGGSPPSGFPGNPNPVPAGSGEGNALIYFYDEAARLDGTTAAENDIKKARDYGKYTIVTTTNYHIQAPYGTSPRSYVFAIATNQSLGEVIELNPTLSLFFDEEPEQVEGFRICRLDTTDMTWHKLDDTSGKPYDRIYKARYLSAALLLPETAPGLYARSLAPEYYRLVTHMIDDEIQ